MEMRGKRGQVAKEVGDEGSFISGRGKNQPEINQVGNIVGDRKLPSCDKN